MDGNLYETPRLVHEYLLFHYGAAEEILPWREGPAAALHFPVRTVTALADPARLAATARALDLGCAVGRSSFEMSRHCGEVIGIDFSHAFIAAAEALREGRTLPYQRVEEAALATTLEAQAPPGCSAQRMRFEQGDAMNLRADLGSFQLVHAANLLCRLAEPQALLERLPDLVAPGGQLLLTTPCTWLAEFTPPANWPAKSTREWLADRLRPAFELDLEVDLPFLIREHARKYQWSVALGMRWTRKS